MVATNTHIYLFDPMMPFVDENGEVVKNGFINVFLAGTSTRVNTYANYGGTLNPINIPLDDSGRVKNPVIVPIDYNYKVALMDDGHDLQNPIKTFDNINCSKVVNNTGSITQGLNSADNTDGQLELTVTDNKLTINGSSTFAKKTELDAAIEEIGDVSDELDAEASARAAADLVLLGKIEDAQGQSASHDYVDSAVAAEALARSNAVSSEASARSSADSALDVRVTALEQGGVGGVPEAPEDGNSYARKDGGWHNVGAEIDAIDEKIPSAASSSNQLADKAYVENMLGDLPVIVRNVSGEDKEVDTVRFVERSTGIGIYAVGENPSDYSGAVAIGSNDIKSENAEKALTVNAAGDGVKFKTVPAITKKRGTADEIEVGKLSLVNGASFASLSADGGTQMDAFTMYGINSNNINGTSAGHALVVNNTGDGVSLRKVPTTTSDLTNDSGFITGSGVNDIQVVDELPAEPVATTLYLIRE